MQRFIQVTIVVATILAPLMTLASTAAAGEVTNREFHQQQRIDQGVRNNTIQRGEYRNLQRRAESIENARDRDLRQNHGHLTPQEYRNLNQRQNNLSRSIYQDKHNERVWYPR